MPVDWGMDLTRPFWHSKKFYPLTAAVMLQFVDFVQRYHAREDIADRNGDTIRGS